MHGLKDNILGTLYLRVIFGLKSIDLLDISKEERDKVKITIMQIHFAY